MDLNQAEKNIKRAWLLSAISIPAFFGAVLLSKISALNLHVFVPWSFPALAAWPILLLLTYTVYRRSRIGAILLFIAYVLGRAFLYPWLYIYPTNFIIVWLLVSLLWGFVFVQGIRGTFVYHKGNVQPSTES